MLRIICLFLALCSLGWALPVSAKVSISFHSYNGSIFTRYPHAFIVLEGTLEETGEAIDENYGFTAKRVTLAVLRGPVRHDIMIEKADYIKKTNRHFTVEISDAQYHRIKQEVAAWRDAPGKYYDLDTRNCIHFVGAMAMIVGLKVEYPKKMLRRPKKWLNFITTLNPQLGAEPIR